MRKFLSKILSLLKKESSAGVAKERLQIILSHQKLGNDGEDFLPKLRHDLIKVISKYVAVDPEQIKVELQKQGSISILELNIMLADAKPVISAK